MYVRYENLTDAEFESKVSITQGDHDEILIWFHEHGICVLFNTYTKTIMGVSVRSNEMSKMVYHRFSNWAEDGPYWAYVKTILTPWIKYAAAAAKAEAYAKAILSKSVVDWADRPQESRLATDAQPACHQEGRGEPSQLPIKDCSAR